jgi:methanogenic corrinoid protein MtbC1
MEPAYELEPASLQRFLALRAQAVEAVAARCAATFDAAYARSGERGRSACKEDLGFQLDFVLPVLEFGNLQPYVEYQRWLTEVLSARAIPAENIEQSLAWLGEFFREQLPGGAGATIAHVMAEAWRLSLLPAEEQVARAGAWPEREPFAAALLEGDRRRALAMVSALRDSGCSLSEIDVHLIQGALYDIGERWLHNEVSVAQEHLATATVRTVMAEAFSGGDFAPANGRKALFACVEGNEHSVGLQMVADTYELDGWDVQCLGANIPIRSLIAQVEVFRPDLVGLSVAFAHQLGTARDTIRQLRERLPSSCPKILVGGGAVNRFKSLADQLGADGHASDALAALRFARPVPR